MCYCPTPTLHLNLALTGDGAFLLSPPKTYSVWFISILNYGDTENVLINHLLLVIPMSYLCHYTNLCLNHINMHTHTHIYMCVCLCIMYIYIYIYIYIYYIKPEKIVKLCLEKCWSAIVHLINLNSSWGQHVFFFFKEGAISTLPALWKQGCSLCVTFLCEVKDVPFDKSLRDRYQLWREDCRISYRLHTWPFKTASYRLSISVIWFWWGCRSIQFHTWASKEIFKAVFLNTSCSVLL